MTLMFMLKNQLLALKDAGEVFAVCSEGKWAEEVRKLGIQVQTMKIKRSMSPFSDFLLFFRLYFYFRKNRFDVVHTHTFKPEFFGQIAAKMAGVPIIFNTLHGFDFSNDDSYFKKNLVLFLEKTAALCSTKIFSIGRNIMRSVLDYKICPPQKLIYLGRDIDTERFNLERFDGNFIAEQKKKLGIKPDKKVVGIIARLVAEKGILDLFKAAREILRVYPETIFLVVGPKEPEKKDAVGFEDAKKIGIEKNVIFAGSKRNVEHYYALMDVFVLPTHREGLGAAILEASAMQKPVVVSDVGGCPETVDDKRTGLIIPAKNPEKIKEALITLLGNEAKALAMGVEGRKKVIREFSKEIVLPRLLDAYGNAIKKLIQAK